MKKIIAFIFFLFAINACTKEEIEDPIIGEWQFRLANTFDEQFWYATIIITFNGDGTGTAVTREAEIVSVSNEDDPCYLGSERGFDWSNLTSDFLANQQTYKFISNYLTCPSVDLTERSIDSRTSIEILRFNETFTEFILDGDVYVKM